MKKKHAPLLILFISLICYIGSEIFLRRATATNIDKERYTIDHVISSLPSSIQSLVKDRIRRGELIDNIREAKTDNDWANYTTTLAMMGSTEIEERNSMLKEVLERAPTLPESQFAYLHFFMNDDAAVKISTEDFQSYAKSLKKDHRYYAWSAGLEKLNELKAKDSQKETYLLPLLEIKPDLRDYQTFYKSLERLANNNGHAETARKAKEKRSSCSKLKTLKRFLSERDFRERRQEQQRRAAEQKTKSLARTQKNKQQVKK